MEEARDLMPACSCGRLERTPAHTKKAPTEGAPQKVSNRTKQCAGLVRHYAAATPGSVASNMRSQCNAVGGGSGYFARGNQ